LAFGDLFLEDIRTVERDGFVFADLMPAEGDPVVHVR
jgi:hypothetical protein